MVATNITLSQSSIIITCFNHVAHKHSSKKVKGALGVTAQKTPVYGTLLLPYVDNTLWRFRIFARFSVTSCGL